MSFEKLPDEWESHGGKCDHENPNCDPDGGGFCSVYASVRLSFSEGCQLWGEFRSRGSGEFKAGETRTEERQFKAGCNESNDDVFEVWGKTPPVYLLKLAGRRLKTSAGKIVGTRRGPDIDLRYKPEMSAEVSVRIQCSQCVRGNGECSGGRLPSNGGATVIIQ